MPLPAPFSALLAERFGKRFSTAEAVRTHHGHDESHFPDALPDGVVWAHSTAEVVEIVNLCREHRVPLIPYGAGSSLEGHILAVNGGLCLDLSEMNQIVAIHGEDMDAVVQPGVTRKTLNAALHGTGLFFPIDPGADASLGGMVSTRASGTNAVRYGTMRENTLGLEVVLADGRVIRTGGRARKSSAGYDLTRLFVGSEGTLGIVTEVTVRLHPLPEAMSSATCAFPDVASAVQTVIQTIQLGVPVARIELLDTLTVQAVNRYSKTTLREAPMLFFEFHGSPTGVEEQAQTVQEIARDNGGEGFAPLNSAPYASGVGEDDLSGIESARGMKHGRNHVEGNDGPNVIIGGDGQDFLNARGGNDLVYGLGGTDILNGDYGGGENPGIFGDDYVDGGAPNGAGDPDRVHGNNGDDTCTGAIPDGDNMATCETIF